ncbi:MAG: FAD-dependent oxidoreductase [Actinobacteria bacterium]|nr:FAD-dependent oxidoreductase [Actinomycetota bacterium]
MDTGVVEHVTCAIAGCGPAGAMLGLLLSRDGVDVLVLEKHADFLRDFRGDTIHPSTVQLIDELGLGEGFRQLPLRRTDRLGAVTDEGEYTLADFRRLPGPYNSLVFLPQWDFLDFLTDHAQRLPRFELRRQAEVSGVIRDEGRVVGLRYRGPAGAEHQVRADLVVAADGRDSTVRRSAGLSPVELGAPVDVLWFRISRAATDPALAFGRLSAGALLVLIDRGEHWQAGYVIPKGGIERVRERGIETLRRAVGALAPFLVDRVAELADWDDVKLLRVQVNRLRRWWRPGLLCIGDAAHAMSPVGGVGINLAIQDAVAAANLLARPLRDGRSLTTRLAAFQARRTLPVVATQLVQRVIQRYFLARLLEGRAGSGTPVALRLLARFPALQGLPARLIGRGLLPEHVRGDG